MPPEFAQQLGLCTDLTLLKFTLCLLSNSCSGQQQFLLLRNDTSDVYSEMSTTSIEETSACGRMQSSSGFLLRPLVTDDVHRHLFVMPLVIVIYFTVTLSLGLTVFNILLILHS